MDIMSDTRAFFEKTPGGVYSPAKEAKHAERHAVLIVGARTRARARGCRRQEKFCACVRARAIAAPSPYRYLLSPASAGYDNYAQHWVVKNSWGTSFGQGGFAKVAYGASQLGIGNEDET